MKRSAPGFRSGSWNRVRWHQSVFAFFCLLLAGCPSAPPTPPAVSRPFAGEEVELLVPSGLQLAARWDVTVTEWMAGSGATTRWVEYEAGDRAALETRMKAPVPTGGRLVLFPLEDLGSIDAALSPLDHPAEQGFDVNDVFRGLRDRVVTRNRAPVAFPVAAPTLLLYYRADLLKRAGKQPPETWDDYQQLLDSLEEWAPGFQAVEPLAPEWSGTLFFARSLAFVKHPENYTVWFDLDSETPLLNSEGFRHAVVVANQAWQRMPPEISQMSPADCRRAVLEGRAALGIGLEPIGPTDDKKIRAESIEIGVRRLPGSRRVFNPNASRWEATQDLHAPALCGFSGQAVGIQTPGTLSTPTAAWHLLAVLAGDQFLSHWEGLPKSPCRESQLGSAATWHETGLTLEESSRAVDGLAQSLRDPQLVADLPLPAASEFRATVRDGIARLRKGEIAPEELPAVLHSDFKRIVQKIGADTLKAGYRRGLGLPPAFQ